MRIIDAKNRRRLDALLRRDAAADAAFDKRVRDIVNAVRRGGDKVLARFAAKFDNATEPLEVSAAEMRDYAALVPREVRGAIKNAARNIAKVAFRQIPKHWDLSIVPGVSIEQRVEPLARVGCYVPGGRFPLPSSLLMTAIPARVAGVRDIVVMCPRPEPAVMAAALEAGVTKMFRIGGAHAIAALAYGTARVPRVDKIVGPGNKFVAAAKAMVAGDCAIDFYAGPTEIVVVAHSGRADWIAADLVAQAEHDPDARSIFITWSRPFAQKVSRLVDAIAANRAIVRQSLRAHGAIVLAGSADAAMELANRIAPEHLVVESESLAQRSVTAGALFIGPYTAQAAGDYATGSNHVLPTAGAARFRGGLSAADFVRVMAVQRVTQTGLKALATTIVPLARAEGLVAHAESIEVRL
jgi:histidinol dehydrogenase